jgi:hypothetical protein
MLVTLVVLTDIYSKADKNGNQKLLKKDSEYKKMFETHGLLAEHYLSRNGVPDKRVCLVKEGDTYFKIKGKFEDIEKLIKPIVIKGYLHGR